MLETLLFLALFSQRKVSEDGRITLINKTLKKLLDLYKRTVFLCSQQTPEMVFVFYSGLLLLSCDHSHGRLLYFSIPERFQKNFRKFLTSVKIGV